MLGLILLLASLICSGIWLFMLFSGNRSGLVFGKSFETYLFLSVGLAVIGSLLIRIAS